MSDILKHADIVIDLSDIPKDKAELFESWLEQMIKNSPFSEFFEFMELNG